MTAVVSVKWILAATFLGSVTNVAGDFLLPTKKRDENRVLDVRSYAPLAMSTGLKVLRDKPFVSTSKCLT